MSHNITALTVLVLLLPALDVYAQRSVSDLRPAHASALQQFLTKHEGLEFLSERVCDSSVLKDMRNNFGRDFKPFYRIGDFNRDGVLDFAMILAKEGGPIEDQGPDIAETHRYLHDHCQPDG